MSGVQKAFVATVLISFVTTGSFSPGYPEEIVEKEVLTREQVVTMALRANPGLIAARKGLDQAAAQAARARVFPNPEVELGVENDALTAGEGEGALSVGVSQEIRTGGKRGHEIALAAKEEERVQREIENLERETVGEVREIFGEILFLQERLRLQEEAVLRAREWVDLTEGRFRAGYVPEFDLNLARIELREQLREKGNIANELAAAKSRLNPLLGREPETVFTASGLLAGGEVASELPALLDRAYRSRPDLKAGEAAMAQARARLAMADTAVFDVNDRTIRDRDHLFGGRISIPLMVLDKKRGEIEEAAAEEGRALLEVAALRAGIAGEVALAYREWRQAEKDADFLSRELLPLAAGNRDLTEEAYRLGKAGILEVMEARRRDLETRLSGLEAAHRQYAAMTAPGHDPGPKERKPVHLEAGEPEGIRLSPEAKKNIGLRTEKAGLRTIEKVLKVNGIVKPQPNRIADVSPFIEGVVERIHVSPGDRVSMGDALVDIRSLQYGNPPPLITLRSPIPGFVARWDLKVGEAVDPSKVLFEVVDPSVVWVEGDVPEEYAGRVEEGQPVRVRAMGYPDRVFNGRIVRSSAVVEPEKRVVHRWVEVENPRLELKPEMFADLAIVVGTADRVLAVPRGAILRQGVETFVYIQKGDLFTKRNVESGMKDDRYVQIVSGVSPGETVVTQGGYELMSSIILKGAGGHGH
ncbi:MAG: efflux RND transporter periplasmic adaptor subunit [Nitrospirae bacterium]|nr:efflux RND transporter periplasmic adaptor subunit [Nitrospirota bacterium]